MSWKRTFYFIKSPPNLKLVWRLIRLEIESHYLDDVFRQFLQSKMDLVSVNSKRYLIELTNIFVISYIYDSFLIEFVN